MPLSKQQLDALSARPQPNQAPFTLELHWPPSLNETYGGRRSGGLYMKAEAKSWRKANAWLIRTQLPHGFQTIDGPVSVHIEFTPPAGRGDIDNRIKCTLDVLERAAVLQNDKQVKSLRVEWKAPKKPGFVRLSVQPINTP